MASSSKSAGLPTYTPPPPLPTTTTTTTTRILPRMPYSIMTAPERSGIQYKHQFMKQKLVWIFYNQPSNLKIILWKAVSYSWNCGQLRPQHTNRLKHIKPLRQEVDVQTAVLTVCWVSGSAVTSVLPCGAAVATSEHLISPPAASVSNHGNQVNEGPENHKLKRYTHTPEQWLSLWAEGSSLTPGFLASTSVAPDRDNRTEQSRTEQSRTEENRIE